MCLASDFTALPLNLLCFDGLFTTVKKGVIIMQFYRAFLVAFSLSCFPNSVIASCADLSLVLAIDSSGSIDPNEFAVQSLGYGAAFQSQAVQRALASAGVVDVAAIYWADADFSIQAIPWHRLMSAKDADAFGTVLMATPRRVFGDTDIGNGLNAAIDMIEASRTCSSRAIINVSGDGKESLSPKRNFRIPLVIARKRAADLGIIINGLAIENEVPELAQYYREKVISGPGSFVMNIKDFTTFRTAIEEKLQKEISFSLVSSLDINIFTDAH